MLWSVFLIGYKDQLLNCNRKARSTFIVFTTAPFILTCKQLECRVESCYSHHHLIWKAGESAAGSVELLQSGTSSWRHLSWSIYCACMCVYLASLFSPSFGWTHFPTGQMYCWALDLKGLRLVVQFRKRIVCRSSWVALVWEIGASVFESAQYLLKVLAHTSIQKGNLVLSIVWNIRAKDVCSSVAGKWARGDKGQPGECPLLSMLEPCEVKETWVFTHSI